MMVLALPDGHAVVSQQEHARMCGQLARAWGNDSVGFAAPADVVCLAAEQHELGMVEFDTAPALDPLTGLPATVKAMELSTHLPLRLRGPRRLADRSPYAALIASLHHTSFYHRPRTVALVRRPARQIRSYLNESAAFQDRLRGETHASDAEIERDWRLVRSWDGLSHALMLERAPYAVRNVPTEGGGLVALQVDRGNGAHTVEPWPFSSQPVTARVEAHVLTTTFDAPDSMQQALAAAPRIELSWTIIPR